MPKLTEVFLIKEDSVVKVDPEYYGLAKHCGPALQRFFDKYNKKTARAPNGTVDKLGEVILYIDDMEGGQVGLAIEKGDDAAVAKAVEDLLAEFPADGYSAFSQQKMAPQQKKKSGPLPS